MRIIIGVGLASALGRAVAAQSEPATIPTVVAQAMTVGPSVFGRTDFFNGQVPPGWPTALVPRGAKILGGGMMGNVGVFRMRVAVFEFTAGSNPRNALEQLVIGAGYAPPDAAPSQSRAGGFANTLEPTMAGKYCNGSTVATFGPVDSTRAPMIFALSIVDGEAGRQTCSPQQRNEMRAGRYPVTVPPMSAPAGALSFGEGSSWSGSSGHLTSTLRTTMPTDSLLTHYTAQLVAGGWKTEGRAAKADGVGLQRFSFLEGKDPWTAALIVVELGERREITLQIARRE